MERLLAKVKNAKWTGRVKEEKEVRFGEKVKLEERCEVLEREAEQGERK